MDDPNPTCLACTATAATTPTTTSAPKPTVHEDVPRSSSVDALFIGPRAMDRASRLTTPALEKAAVVGEVETCAVAAAAATVPAAAVAALDQTSRVL